MRLRPQGQVRQRDPQVLRRLHEGAQQAHRYVLTLARPFQLQWGIHRQRVRILFRQQTNEIWRVYLALSSVSSARPRRRRSRCFLGTPLGTFHLRKLQVPTQTYLRATSASVVARSVTSLAHTERSATAGRASLPARVAHGVAA
jgi:malonyl CoA-acyl carrier protein transacylase